MSVSIPGSLLTLTGVGERTPSYRKQDAASGIYLRCIRGRNLQAFVFLLVPTIDGQVMENPIWSGAPGSATVREGDKSLTIRFNNPRELVIEGRGIGLHAEGFPGYFDWVRQLPNKRWRYHAGSLFLALDLIPITGELEIDAPWEKLHSSRVHFDLRPGTDGHCRMVLRERELQCSVFDDKPESPTWDAVTAFNRWAEPLIAGLPDLPTALRAAHVLWAHQAGPDGLLAGRVIMAGKSWMPAAYGWDQCFCAAAIAHADPDLAWEQLALFYGSQDSEGCIPAFFSPDRIAWNTTMPPLQGWCLRRLRQVPGCITPERLAWIIPRLEANVRWWLRRDEDGDGVPEYYHGNDSGWDNGSCFHGGGTVAAPDLMAYLIECCTALTESFTALGNTAGADSWREEESRLVSLVNNRFVHQDRLVARRYPSGEVAPGDSLLPLIGLRLGMRLPENVRNSSIDALRDPKRFLAPFGLATESLSSPFHEADAYWRGPVWAPTTWLLAEALEGIGERDLAREILARFCKACAQDGFAENFDPISGKGLRDRSYAWTAGVYLMAQRHLQQNAK